MPRAVRITVQGGIGTAAEDALLREHYGADGTGWATPFLLVPEVTNVDEEHLRKLAAASDEDVFLSDSSPFGMPFWNLRNSASEDARRRRIATGQPGSPCIKGFVQLFNVEFTPLPICTASREYQRLKLEQIERAELGDQQRAAARRAVLAKSCICHDLAGVATLKNGIDPRATPAVCCGPNIVNFTKIATLEEMVGHVYGRVSLLTNPARPQMFISELALYIDFLRDELERLRLGLSAHTIEYFREFRQNLRDGIDHYRQLSEQFEAEERTRFLVELERLGGIARGHAAGRGSHAHRRLSGSGGNRRRHIQGLTSRRLIVGGDSRRRFCGVFGTSATGVASCSAKPIGPARESAQIAAHARRHYNSPRHDYAEIGRAPP